MRTFIRSCCVVLLLFGTLAALGQTKEARDKYNKALKELDRQNLPKAEELLKKATAASPDWAAAQMLLGDVLFGEKKYAAAAEAYGQAHRADDAKKQLSADDRRNTLDQEGVSLAIDRRYDKALAVYRQAVTEDPEYPLYEYNYACVYSEMGDLDSALVHLKKAWGLRANMPRGQAFPDPRQDSSFRRWLNDPHFQKAVADMVI